MKNQRKEEVVAAAPELRVWVLRARDVNEPPFHFARVAVEFIVIAASPQDARGHAASQAVPHGDVWLDEAMTGVDELPMATGIVAVKLSA